MTSVQLLFDLYIVLDGAAECECVHGLDSTGEFDKRIIINQCVFCRLTDWANSLPDEKYRSLFASSRLGDKTILTK